MWSLLSMVANAILDWVIEWWTGAARGEHK
jgi:hypothetical protein